VKETGRVLEPVWSQWRRQKPLLLPGIEHRDSRLYLYIKITGTIRRMLLKNITPCTISNFFPDWCLMCARDIILEVTARRPHENMAPPSHMKQNENRLWGCKVNTGTDKFTSCSLNTSLLHVTNLLTSSEAESRSAGQEIPSHLRKPNLHYRVHKCPPLDPRLCQTNPIHIFRHYYFKIYLYYPPWPSVPFRFVD